MTLKSAVVGGGSVSTVHLSALAQHSDVELCAVCDVDESRAGDRASAYDIRAYGDFEGMLALESLDWIHVCTPTDAHVEQVRMALEDDVALQIESPLTASAPAAEELARLARERDASVSVVHDGVFEPAIQRADELIDEGAIGTLRAIDLLYTGEPWPHEIGDRDWVGHLCGGAFEAELARPISQVLELGGFPASRSAIAAGATRRRSAGDRFDYDGATFQYTTPDGVCCSGTVVASDVPRRVVRIHGDRGSLVADLIAGTVTVRDEDDTSHFAGSVIDTAERLVTQIRDAGSELLAMARRSVGEKPDDAASTHEALIDAEIEALRGDRTLPVPLEAGVWSVHVMEAIKGAAAGSEPEVTVAPEIDAD